MKIERRLKFPQSNLIGGIFKGEMALQLGTMYSGEEALKLRLVDELVEPKDLMPRSIEAMRKWCKIPSELNSQAVGTLLRAAETILTWFCLLKKPRHAS